MSIAPTRIAILASGSGSNAEAILRHFEGSETVDVAFVGCNRPETQAGIYERTRQMGVETTRFNKAELLDGGLLQALHSKGIDWVVLAGFLMHIPETLVRAYRGRMLNVHPSLLPKFGGKGMYGLHVHRAVLVEGFHPPRVTIFRWSPPNSLDAPEGAVRGAPRAPCLRLETTTTGSWAAATLAAGRERRRLSGRPRLGNIGSSCDSCFGFHTCFTCMCGFGCA